MKLKPQDVIIAAMILSIVLIIILPVSILGTIVERRLRYGAFGD